jgi:hypothetical protein
MGRSLCGRSFDEEAAMHAIHFMTLAVSRGRRGWIAPVELTAETQQSGTLTAPVDPQGNLFPDYRLEFVKYLGGGSSVPGSSILELQPSGLLKCTIDGANIRFRLRMKADKPVVFEYVGQLSHPDFGFPLAEIEPESEQHLDDLYAREKIVLAGCDPCGSYSGLAYSTES